MEKIVQTAGRNKLGEFAPDFAHFNDDILFGEDPFPNLGLAPGLLMMTRRRKLSVRRSGSVIVTSIPRRLTETRLA